MATYVVGSNSKQVLLCETEGLDYVPDPVKHPYGVSTRRPIEDWFLTLLEFAKGRYPGYQFFTLGTSLVFGEKFVTYLTVCEFTIRPGSFEDLQRAVRGSDQAIRKKVGSMWEWGCCLFDNNNNRAAVVIGWLDFAYFAQHHNDFLDTKHNHFTAAFGPSEAKAIDFKVLHDGSIVEFDQHKLPKSERKLFDKPSNVRFDIVNLDRPDQRTPMRMV